LKPLFFSHNGNPELFNTLIESVSGEAAEYENHEFPDGESYVRIYSTCAGRDAIILGDLHRPNPKILPLVFLCETLRSEGIARIVLVLPYLPYMRQDIQFHPGEGVTSRFFAALLSRHVDHLITIDPHLHRYDSLDEIYSIPSQVLAATPCIAEWIHQQIDAPLIVGPDSESEQWAARTAEIVDCPYIVLEKTRFGDRDVEVSAPQAEDYLNHTPVLIDDIISTGRTMIKTAEALQKEGLKAPVCIGVHALFSGDALSAMRAAPIDRIVTCNTIAHETNAIDIAGLLGQALGTV